MTPGQLALAEAARLESARIYGRVQREQPAVDVDAHDVQLDMPAEERIASHMRNVIALNPRLAAS